jgi:hypothetical protein
VGRGYFGTVVQLSGTAPRAGCDFALKIQRAEVPRHDAAAAARSPVRAYAERDHAKAAFRRRVLYEIEMQKAFAAAGLAPRVFMFCFFTHRDALYAATLMEPIDGILMKHLAQYAGETGQENIGRVWADTLTGALDTLCAHRLIHGDLHLGNAGYKWVFTDDDAADADGDRRIAVPHLMLIDFGWASRGNDRLPCHPQLELLQLLSSLNDYQTDSRTQKIPKRIYDTLMRRLVQDYDARGFVRINWADIRRQFNALHDGYKRHYRRMQDAANLVDRAPL